MNLATRLAGAGAAVLVPLIQPVMLGAALTTLVTAATQQPAAAQSAEAVAKVAQAITVRIEGATQGSGVLVKRDGNRYTVLTAWHVVEGQRPGEELDIYTPDGMRHPVEQGSIKRFGVVDMAVITFSSKNLYQLANINDKEISTGEESVLVSGFASRGKESLTQSRGKILASTRLSIQGGYELMYSSQTSRGMSGGPILTTGANLLGIHGRGSYDKSTAEVIGTIFKNIPSKGVPIRYYRMYILGSEVDNDPAPRKHTDDYILQAIELDDQGRTSEALILLDKALSIAPNALLFSLRAQLRHLNGDLAGAKLDYIAQISLGSRSGSTLSNLAQAESDLGDHRQALRTINAGIEHGCDDLLGACLIVRANIKVELGHAASAASDYERAINSSSNAIVRFSALNQYARLMLATNRPDDALRLFRLSLAISPDSFLAHSNISSAHLALGDTIEAINAASRSIELNPSYPLAYFKRAYAFHATGQILKAELDYGRFISLVQSSHSTAIIEDYREELGLAFNRRGSIRSSAGKSQIAIQDFSQAIKVNPGRIAPYMNLFFEFVRMGDLASACLILPHIRSLAEQAPELSSKLDADYGRVCS